MDIEKEIKKNKRITIISIIVTIISLTVTIFLAVNYINTKTEDTNASVKDRIAPSVEKWLAGFIAGKFMVVDSFHAMVFSIIFQRDFVVIGNKKRGLSRFESLLKGLGLADRLVFNKDEALMVAGRPINWDNVQERINSLRDKSYCFLQNALGK